MAQLDWSPVSSSNVSAAAYDTDKQELMVRFRNGSVYAYKGANQALYDEFLSAASPGAFVRHTLSAYDYERRS